MKFQRRELLKLGLLHTIALAISNKAQAQEFPTIIRRTDPSILQGATDDSKTQFSIVYDKNVELEIYATDSSGRTIAPDSIKALQFEGHPLQITKAYFSGLRPNENYELHIVSRQTQKELDQRFFQTLDLQKPNLSFALCSCMKDTSHSAAIWKNLIAQKPDVIFFIGDAVYADQENSAKGAEPLKLWRRFCDARQILEIYFSKTLIPILATWDDHDFGRNNGNMSNFPYVKESQKNFLSFFAQDEGHCDILQQGPGVSSALTLRNHLFILFDDRSYRQKQSSKHRYAHWGEEQENWAVDLIRHHKGSSWLMNGSQIFPSLMFKESMAGNHPAQLNGFLAAIRQFPSRVVFASGDVHYSEISRIEPKRLGYETYEITSSAMHSRSIPGAPDIIPNSRRIAGAGQKNFIMVYSTPQGYGSNFRLVCQKETGDVAFSLDLQV